MGDVERRIQAGALVCVSWETRRSRRARARWAARLTQPAQLERPTPVRAEPSPAFTELHLMRHGPLTLCGRRPPPIYRRAIMAHGSTLETMTGTYRRTFAEEHAGGCVACAARAALLTGEHVAVVDEPLGMEWACSCGEYGFVGPKGAGGALQAPGEAHLDHVVRVCRAALGGEGP